MTNIEIITLVLSGGSLVISCFLLWIGAENVANIVRERHELGEYLGQIKVDVDELKVKLKYIMAIKE